MHAFQQQDSPLTLGEGLADYQRAYPDLAKLRDMSPEGREFFRCHDAAHIVFGCDTSLPQEAVVKLSSIFGTTAGFGVLRGYALHESTDIYRELRLAEVAATTLRSVAIVPRTLARCLRQHKKWPWQDFARYEHTALAALRAEFGIRVPSARASGRA